MREIIEQLGFFMIKACTCGGTYNETFRHKADRNIIIKLYPKKSYFTIQQIKYNSVLIEQKVNELLQKNNIANNG